MIKIRIEENYRCHCGGYCLYFNGNKTHIGYIVSLSALREFWAKNMSLIIAGYVQELDGSFKKFWDC